MKLRLPGSRVVLIFSLISIVILTLTANKSRAESLAVTLSVGDTYFVVNGFTSPNAMVTVKESSAVVATTQADGQGAFTATVLTDPGIHEYSLYAIDTASVTTATYSQTVSLTSGTTTTVGNYVIPPTISSSAPTYVRGTTITVSGQTVPTAQVYVFVDTAQAASTISNSTGTWTTEIATTGLELLPYTLYAKTQIAGGYTSENSATISATITAEPASPAPGASSTTTSNNNSSAETESPATSPVTPTQRSVPHWFPVYDRDQNGVLNLRDITNILTVWVTGLRDYLRGKPETRASGNCDINDDGKCDLYDFSILLYYIDRQV